MHSHVKHYRLNQYASEEEKERRDEIFGN